MKLTRNQYLIGVAFQAGVAYLLYKHGHPNWSLFFATGAAANAILAAGAP